MNIHIRKPVEFEKIIANHDSRYIELTRHRMAVQQLLDSADNRESLKSRLGKYIDGYEKVCTSIDPSQKLQKQPLFDWVVDGQPVQSSCWKFESVIARTVLSNLVQSEAAEKIGKGEYVSASKLLKEASEQHKKAFESLLIWKWKLASANHPIVQKTWHVGMVHHLQSLQHLCMLCIGLEKQSPSKTLYVVAQRAVASAAKSIAFWPDRISTLKIGQSMQCLMSSHILWDREEYGGSIERLQSWFGHDNVDALGFQTLQDELDKVPFLLKEREQINNGAYFDPVKASHTLPSPQELIYMGPKDVPHPQCTRNNPMESSLAEEHESAPLPEDA